MSCGGSGFVTLIHKDNNRLAYLQNHQVRYRGSDGGLSLSFYQLWNAPHPWWQAIFEDPDTLIEELQAGGEDGTLELKKIIKSPNGIMRAKVYDLTTAVFSRDPDHDEKINAPTPILKYIQVCGRNPPEPNFMNLQPPYPLAVKEIV